CEAWDNSLSGPVF
nr:immunoglobulin light chain junction region [Macaca mulatta]MPN79701.1 immunoglobulin light chain junction region [Macaca mulatta]MPN79703.1 immunoglobulin light chain junction region [Macaca mulatta]MPN79704.1 immunoglobulin light chain junction region [Macaca mulatta]MPN79709.1 immunoglobulin light chain junction region [Macaca mulatta]